jgi:hypothetical protein
MGNFCKDVDGPRISALVLVALCSALFVGEAVVEMMRAPPQADARLVRRPHGARLVRGEP